MIRDFLGVALVVALCSITAIGQQAPIFRVTGETVPVFVTVTDKANRLVTTLERGDFQVSDNGRPQPLTAFDNAPQPVRLIVMLDVSGSMVGNLPLLQEASVELFGRLSRGDLARVGTFGRSIEISPAFTGDARALRAALPLEIAPDAPTPLWKAIDQAIATFGEVDGRHVILVLSDGKDGAPHKFGERYVGQLEVSERAQREEVMIYAVGLRSRAARRPMGAPGGSDIMAMLAADLPDPGLGTVALDTGGGYFEIGPRDDLAAAFARVAEELHSQYLLGFAPATPDGKVHKIEVRVGVKDVKARARKNYKAPGK